MRWRLIIPHMILATGGARKTLGYKEVKSAYENL